MSDTDGLGGNSKPRTPRRRRRLRLGLALAGAFLAGAALGTGGIAVAAGMAWHGGWHHGPRLAMVQAAVGHALDAVGATSAQEAKIHDIVARSGTALGEVAADRDAARRRALDILRSPTLDRSAAEALRAEQVARLDAMSKVLVGAVLDAAEQLDPGQRAALAARIEARIDSRGGMGDGAADAGSRPGHTGVGDGSGQP